MRIPRAQAERMLTNGSAQIAGIDVIMYHGEFRNAVRIQQKDKEKTDYFIEEKCNEK